MSKPERDVHQPVLVDEVVEALEPLGGGLLLDLTLGAGGHARALLERSSPDGILFGLDQDPHVLAFAGKKLEEFGDRVTIRQGNFAEADTIFADVAGQIDGILLDLGVSSLQLDDPGRGFSFRNDGPLDMRMDPGRAATAERFLNEGLRDELLHAVGVLGEEPRAKAIVRAILEERKIRPLYHTTDLRELVEQVYKRRGGRIHPATRTFQGIRMVVNAELESLERGLAAAFGLLKEGGRMAVIAFHSGEDRIVKEFLKSRQAEGAVAPGPLKVVKPSAAEVRRNRRSRSARLRISRRVRPGADNRQPPGHDVETVL